MQLDLSTHQRDEYRQRGPEDEESANHDDDMELRLSMQVTNSAGSSKKDVGEHIGTTEPHHHQIQVGDSLVLQLGKRRLCSPP